MRNFFVIITMAVMFSTTAVADDKPVDFNKLPSPAREFINVNYPEVKVVYSTVDDDFIRPDYKVMLSNGVKIEFEHNGELEKIECRSGSVPAKVIPVQIMEYVKTHYPDSDVIEYEVGKRSYEVKLSNRLELKFSSSFYLIEIDD